MNFLLPIRISGQASGSLSRRFSTTMLYLGFAGTGIGMALPGSVLPALLKQWSLGDGQAGFFFFLGWLGTSVGALLVRPSRVWSLSLGTFLTAAGAMGMAYGSGWICFGFMGVFGVGLGMAMTATSLLQAARNVAQRGMELNRLNLVWALGACVAPALATHSLQVANIGVIFSAVGLFFALICLWTVVGERDSEAVLGECAVAARQRPPFLLPTLWPAALVIAVSLPTGIEASMGGWTAAYVLRAEKTISITVTAGTCFWVGLLISRMIGSFVLRKRGTERAVLCQSLTTVVLGMLLLIATHASLGILVGVFLVGFGLGPVYPLLLDMALQYSENTLIFFVAGLGSAVFPWLTGIVSSSSASLRVGLLVPLACSLLMLALGLHLVWRSGTANFSKREWAEAKTDPHPAP